jgi:hypothetical protein
MKRIFLIIIIVTTGFLAAMPMRSWAGCATRQDNLEDFARCMAPMKGTIGTTTVYSSGEYDQDHSALISAMMRSDGVPSQVVPASAMIAYPSSNFFMTPAAYMNLYFAGHSSYASNWFRFASFYSPAYGMNPYLRLSAAYRY